MQSDTIEDHLLSLWPCDNHESSYGTHGPLPSSFNDRTLCRLIARFNLVSDAVAEKEIEIAPVTDHPARGEAARVIARSHERR